MSNSEIPQKKTTPDKMAYLRKIGFYMLLTTLITYYILAIEVIFLE